MLGYNDKPAESQSDDKQVLDCASKHLFLVSTPLHLLVSLAIISKENLKHTHLIFIDQVSGKANVYLDTLKSWPDQPFGSTDVFFRPPRKLISKLKARKQTFSELEKIVGQIKPSHIYVGNDRRIEFQYAMHLMQQSGKAAQGIYLDEGTFTYVGRKASSSVADRYIDNLAKKLSYGLWWKHPETVGASAWVDKIYVSYPLLVHPALKQKPFTQLDLSYWQAPLLTQFCHLLLSGMSEGIDFASFDVLLTLPHESIIQSDPKYKTTIEFKVSSLLREDLTVAVKYHPRDGCPDALGLEQLGVTILPASIPFEAMLPTLKSKAMVVGDFSSTLISTRLLRPDLDAVAIDKQDNPLRESFLPLYQSMGIKVES